MTVSASLQRALQEHSYGLQRRQPTESHISSGLTNIPHCQQCMNCIEYCRPTHRSSPRRWIRCRPRKPFSSSSRLSLPVIRHSGPSDDTDCMRINVDNVTSVKYEHWTIIGRTHPLQESQNPKLKQNLSPCSSWYIIGALYGEKIHTTSLAEAGTPAFASMAAVGALPTGIGAAILL